MQTVLGQLHRGHLQSGRRLLCLQVRSFDRVSLYPDALCRSSWAGGAKCVAGAKANEACVKATGTILGKVAEVLTNGGCEVVFEECEADCLLATIETNVVAPVCSVCVSFSFRFLS